MKPFVKTEILLPDETTDLSAWAVLACDQFTSQPEYWQKVQGICQGENSTLHITLPEVYLEQPDVAHKIDSIHKTMEQYKTEVLTKKVNGFVYTERVTESGTRCGLVGAVDLEQYSYQKDTQPPIRPTEGTIISRIPPRIAVRRGASLETPHILMLLDDANGTIIEPLKTKKNQMKPLYNTSLMLDGGQVSGWAVTEEETIQTIETAVEAFGTQAVFDALYPDAAGKTPLAMAVGDGNHSLATAKAYWEEIKPTLSPQQQQTHPARFCLVELVNLHSEAMCVEPIHRVVFGIDSETLFAKWEAFLQQHQNASRQQQQIRLLSSTQERSYVVKNSPHPLAVGTVELFLAQLDVRVDYIHGEDAVRTLVAQGAIGILLPDFAKSDLFKGVVLGGSLPKKTFSMGHAQEKRYYLECRRIVNEG